ncbi:orotate phosphoribosyltransferase [Coxiella endosymbiont of Ornithodoros amblus]|uniref:orotate phosphoribosyltransferase n=1 Tax=Coxiella endosymbiont of Ornithodoros amblus TaxID=1656166 RepID=UPI00244E34BB|nr:orotate phosphoribosyltransferase [Coxiella endosymbiont of Ornithodoros amblus]MBW5802822.1 orotate phosphoribosyltransferase [Coxiella endosymbiont of Ornithodoros amblus]
MCNNGFVNQATEIAKLLLNIKAVTLNLYEPYRYISGILSPIYCDNRLIISYPEKRKVIIEAFLQLIEKNHLSFDVIAGTATAGIPHTAWIADRLNLPMVYVRAKAKIHGKQNQIEGRIRKGQRTLIVEDLISTGKSALAASLVLREKGVTITDCIAIFSYQLPQAQKNFSDANINCHALSHFDTLIEMAVDEGYIDEIEKQKALAWNKDPEHWQP